MIFNLKKLIINKSYWLGFFLFCSERAESNPNPNLMNRLIDWTIKKIAGTKTKLAGNYGSLIKKIAGTKTKLAGNYGYLIKKIAGTKTKLAGNYGSLIKKIAWTKTKLAGNYGSPK